MMKLTIMVVSAATLLGCGGSGVSDSKKITELTTEEAKDVCQEMAEDFPEKTVTCEGGLSFKVGIPAAECDNPDVAPATCTATVGDARACNEAIYSQSDAELCSDTPLPAACAPLEGC
jgi:hypothetical protein